MKSKNKIILPSNTINYLQTYFSFPIVRIICLLVLFFGLSVGLTPYSPYEFIYYNVHLLIILFAISYFIESYRSGSFGLMFGLYLNKSTLKQISIGIILSISFFAVYSLLMLSYSATFNFNITSGLLNIAIIMLMTALVEEIAFRGILLRSLSEMIGRFPATVLLSIIFSAIHLANPNINIYAFLNIFIASILFSIMYFKTNALWLPISFHFAWNFLQGGILGINVSGFSFPDSLLSVSLPDGLPYLLGSEFGAESSILATAFLIASVAVIVNIDFYKSKSLFDKRKYIEMLLRKRFLMK